MIDIPITSRWFAIHSNMDINKPRLFCFPYGGGNAMIFRKWQDRLDQYVDVYPVQLPGRGIRIQEPSFRELEPLIEELVEAFQPYIHQSYFFFGHSMGALIAFELARFLQKHFRSSPKHLIVSGFRAPHLPNPKPPIHHLPDQAFSKEIAKMNGTPKEILENAEYLEFFLPSLRADFQLCETYQYQKGGALHSPITAFGGTEDPDVDEAMLEAWKIHTHCQFRLIQFPGDHFFIHHEEQAIVQKVIEIIKES